MQLRIISRSAPLKTVQSLVSQLSGNHLTDCGVYKHKKLQLQAPRNLPRFLDTSSGEEGSAFMTSESGHTSGQVWGEINVTPMIDLLLVLLIIFMVIAPVVPHALDAALPHPSISGNIQPETPIVVQIMNAGNGRLGYKINQEDVKINELGSRLSLILSARANKVMFVKGSDNLDFAAVARVMDIAKGAGADHIGLITDKKTL
jgi:biopolymer transport protein TolR